MTSTQAITSLSSSSGIGKPRRYVVTGRGRGNKHPAKEAYLLHQITRGHGHVLLNPGHRVAGGDGRLRIWRRTRLAREYPGVSAECNTDHRLVQRLKLRGSANPIPAIRALYDG